MLPWIFASILSGSLLSSAECVFIVLTCGPFWIRPGLFLATWLIYAVLSALGLALLSLIPKLIPAVNRSFQDARKRFFLLFNSSWLIGSALLVALVASDSYAGSEYLTLALIAAFMGVLTSFIMRWALKAPEAIPRVALITSLCLILLTNSVYRLSDWHYSASVSRRSEEFNGKIPHACLLVMDTARGDHFSCYGYPYATSPNIDQLAAEGLLCRNAYSASNWTPPGHISIFTGKYPFQHGNDGKVYMPDDLVSLTEILNRQGYYCVAMYNNPTAGRSINLTQGFDLDIGVYGHSWVYPAPYRLRDKFLERDSGAKITFLMAQRTFEWMQKRGGHMFLYINITEPHAPYAIHEPYFSQFAKSVHFGKILNWSQVQDLRTTLDLVLNDSARFAGCTEESYAFLRAAYDSEIAYMDHYLGRFVDRMKEEDLLDDVLLVMTADHGEFLGEHFTLGHPELLYNPVLKIPLILRYPALIEPKVTPGYVSNVDIFPTVLNLMDLADKIPSDVLGCNIVSDQLAQDRPLLAANISPEGGCYSLIDGHYKLIINNDNFLPRYFPYDTLMFDLSGDPEEMVNLKHLETGTRDELSRQLSSWITETSVRPQSTIQVSNTTLANLKALGYVH